MKLTTVSKVGTLESNDISVILEPSGSDANEIHLTSSVMYQYGASIKQTIEQTLQRYGAQGVKVTANDRGALDCTIEARMEVALEQASMKEGV